MNDNLVQVKYGGRTMICRPNQCTVARIITHFGILNNPDVYLKKISADGGETTEWAENGRFDGGIRGSWDLVVNVEATVNNSNGGSASSTVGMNGMVTLPQQVPLAAARPPVALASVPMQQGRLSFGRSHQMHVGLFDASMVTPLDGDQQGSLPIGNRQRNTRRRLDLAGVGGQSEPSKFTIHFHAAKRVSKSTITEKAISGIRVVPVTFEADEMKSISKMNDKLTAVFKGREELSTAIGSGGRVVIFGPEKYELLQFDEMKADGIRYWQRTIKNTTKLYAVPDTDTEFPDSDSEDEQEKGKRRLVGNSSEKKVNELTKKMKSNLQTVSKLIETLNAATNAVMDMRAQVQGAEVKDFLGALSRSCYCNYCSGVANPPVQCEFCHQIVACKSCADDEKKLVSDARMKQEGEWTCPRCNMFFSYGSTGYRVMKDLDLTYLKKLDDRNNEDQ